MSTQIINPLQHQCSWEMTVSYNDKTIVVGYPLTVNFNVRRDTFASSNNATFDIYNLSPSNRSSEFFFQDRFNTDKKKLVTFKAGYEGSLTTIFKGYILQSYSKRNGVDVVTSMQCLDMGSLTDYVCTTFEAGTTFKDAVTFIVNTTSDLTLGNIGTLDGTFQTPTTVEGTPLECLNIITGGHAYVDNGLVNILQNNEAIESYVTELRADSGLISTPERRDAQVEVTSIFNPNFVVGQWLNIKSDVASDFTGTYKICGIAHQGIISGAVSGQRTTTLNLMSGAFLPASNYNVTGKIGNQAQSVKGEQIKPLNGSISNNAVQVSNYVKAHGGRIPNGRIIGSITWRDMLGHDNQPADIQAQITPAICQNCITIATKLNNYLYANVGSTNITITSGWRTTQNNTAAKGKPDSAHLRGLAIDFTFNNRSNYQTWQNVFNKSWDRYTYYKAKYNIIHVQATYGRGGARR